MGKGFELKGWHVALIVLLFLAWQFGYIKIPTQQVVQQPPTQPTGTELVSVNKPLKFSLSDPYAGSAIASANIYIYGSDKVLKESLTTASDGTITSALPYASDSLVRVKVAKSGYVTRWIDVVVPKMTSADAQSLTTNFIALQTCNLGTYSIKVTDQFGNSYSTGGALNFTTLGATTVAVTITVYNTEDNSGWFSSYDFINGINLNCALQTKTSGSSVTVSGAGSSVARGTDTYWVSVLSDDGLTRQLVGNTYVKQGVTSVVITFGKGSLAAGESQAFTFYLKDYFDQTYFASNGIGGPDEATLASFTLTFKA